MPSLCFRITFVSMHILFEVSSEIHTETAEQDPEDDEAGMFMLGTFNI